MEKIIDFLPFVLWGLVVLAIWFFIRNVLLGLSDRINNSELYKEDMLNVLEEIREELKELNKKNSVK